MLTDEQQLQILTAIQNTFDDAAKLSIKDAIEHYVTTAVVATIEIICTIKTMNEEDNTRLIEGITRLVTEAGESAHKKCARLIGFSQRMAFDRNLSANLAAIFLREYGLDAPRETRLVDAPKGNRFREVSQEVRPIKKEDSPFVLTIAKADYNAQRYSEVISKLEGPVKEYPYCIEARNYLANSYFHLEHYDLALGHFEILAEQERVPVRLSNYYDSIGLCYFEKENHNMAALSFLFAVRFNDNNASAHVNLAKLYMELAYSLKGAEEKEKQDSFERLISKSQQRLEKLLEIKPRCPYVQQLVGAWHELLEHYPEAIVCYLKSSKYCEPTDISLQKVLSEELAKCYVKLGNLLTQEQEYSTAIKAFQEALKQDKRSRGARSQLAACLFKLDKFAEAKTQFNTLIKELENPRSISEAWAARAACLRETKKFALAKGGLVIASEFAPQNALISKAKQKLENKAAITIQQKWRFFKDNQRVLSQQQEEPNLAGRENPAPDAAQSSGYGLLAV